MPKICRASSGLARFAIPLILTSFAAHAADDDFAYGRRLYRDKAQCSYCHGWAADGAGEPQSNGGAANLRDTKMNRDQLIEVILCGRPATPMPHFDELAYTDKRCYGYTREQMDKDMPPAGNDFLSNREVDAVVKYLFAKDVGRGPATYEDCIDFWGTETKQCEPMKK